MERIITREYLANHPNEIFVFGDNTERVGMGGAALLRNMPNTYGFITKKRPSHNPEDYYRPNEYEKVFYVEVAKLIQIMKENPDKKYLISKLGAGLANQFNIYEEIIQPKIRKLLTNSPNAEFLYEEKDDLMYKWWGYVGSNNYMNVFKYVDDRQFSHLIKYGHGKNVVKEFYPFVVEASTKEEALKLLQIEYIAQTDNEESKGNLKEAIKIINESPDNLNTVG